MARIKIGVIGHLGSIGSRHYKNFNELGCEVIGHDVALGDHLPIGFQNCDGVVIACPTPQHIEWIDYFDSRSISMLVEKPVVSASPFEMNFPADHIRMVGYNLRFHSCIKKVRQWLGDGLIGKPLWARFTCAQHNDKPAYRRDGVILNWSHEIDLAQYLLGPMDFIAAASIPDLDNGGEDCADIIVRHRAVECQTVIHLDYLTRPERRGFIIVGESGSIDADLVSRQAFCKDANGGLLHNHFGRDSFDGNYVSEAKAFLALLRGEKVDEEVIPCSAKEALDVVDICFKAKDDAHGC